MPVVNLVLLRGSTFLDIVLAGDYVWADYIDYENPTVLLNPR